MYVYVCMLTCVYVLFINLFIHPSTPFPSPWHSFCKALTTTTTTGFDQEPLTLCWLTCHPPESVSPDYISPVYIISHIYSIYNVYVCICACVHVGMCVCACVHVYVCICVCVYMCMCMRDLCGCIYIYICVCVWM